MKAIDFACRFLSRLQKDNLSPAARLVLIAVAAGLEDKTDIARETCLAVSVVTTQLRHLEMQGEVRCSSPLSERYVLAPAGKEQLRRLFNFHNVPDNGEEEIPEHRRKAHLDGRYFPRYLRRIQTGG